jgi:hypothetical protein
VPGGLAVIMALGRAATIGFRIMTIGLASGSTLQSGARHTQSIVAQARELLVDLSIGISGCRCTHSAAVNG